MSLFGLTRRVGAAVSKAVMSTCRASSVISSTKEDFLPSSLYRSISQLTCKPLTRPAFLESSGLLSRQVTDGSAVPSRSKASLGYMHRKGAPLRQVRKTKSSPLEGRPQLRGIVLKTLIKKPKKPNSANRKCVRVRLSTGREAIAYVPGEGHNLQEHNIVLVQGGGLQDTPGVKLTCVRGKFDLPHVKKK